MTDKGPAAQELEAPKQAPLLDVERPNPGVSMATLSGNLYTLRTEMRNRFEAVRSQLDAIEGMLQVLSRAAVTPEQRIEVRTAKIDVPLPNSEPAKVPKNGKPDELPADVTLWSPERTDPRLAKLHAVAQQLIQALSDKSNLPQKLQASLVRASDAWQQYVSQKHSHHKLSASTYNRVAKYDVRWYRNAKGEYSWNWPLNSEPLSLAFVEALAQVCRAYRVDTAGILKRGKVEVSEQDQ